MAARQGVLAGQGYRSKAAAVPTDLSLRLREHADKKGRRSANDSPYVVTRR